MVLKENCKEQFQSKTEEANSEGNMKGEHTPTQIKNEEKDVVDEKMLEESPMELNAEYSKNSAVENINNQVDVKSQQQPNFAATENKLQKSEEKITISETSRFV